MSIHKRYHRMLKSLQVQVEKDLKKMCDGHVFFHD